MKINYDGDVCQHAGICVQTLPKVYMIKDGKFVVDSTQATEEDLTASIAACPSGALSTSAD
jgi:uncharacterized Fe-S cluster protein YjdI